MSNSKPSLPPYLISGASSRSHHALLSRLNDAQSTQEEESIMLEEVKRLKGVLIDQRVKMGKIVECLIVLLHCFVMGSKEVMAVVRQDWSLMAGSRVAESGTSLKERRIGYLYLSEVMPSKHDLHLMLINTIRKDLTSSNPHDILLALHAILAHPKEELAPAVEPILATKALLRHKLPAVRQRAIQALIALDSVTLNPSSFLIPLSQLAKLLKKERDPAVLTALFRAVKLVLENEPGELQEITGLIIARSEGLGREGLVAGLECLKRLKYDQQSIEGIQVHLKTILGTIAASSKGSKGTNIDEETADAIAAILLDICAFFNKLLNSDQNLMVAILLQLEDLASPATGDGGSSAATSSAITPKDHVLLLRCLNVLPKEMWETRVSEKLMEVVMAGLDSFDPSIRKMTTRLLYTLSPDLTEMSMAQNLASIHSSTNLVLPLRVPSRLDAAGKVKLGRRETAERALEVLEIVYVNDGKGYGRGVIGVLEALGEGDVWEGGVRRILDSLDTGSPAFKDDCCVEVFAQSAERKISNSATVIKCAMATDISRSMSHFDLLLDDLETHSASVPELILFSCLGILGHQTGHDGTKGSTGLEESLRGLLNDAETSPMVRKRCKTISRILQTDQLERAVSSAKSSSIPDLLESVLRIDAEILREQSFGSISTTDSPVSHSLSPSRLGTGLRYEAYDRTGSSMEQLRPASKSASNAIAPKTRNMAKRGMTAGEYALLMESKENDEVKEGLPADLGELSLYR